MERLIADADPAISVVIPTLPDRTLEVLPSLQAQTLDRFEVVVIEDRERSISAARNAGLMEAGAPIVANTDDDCRVPADWLETIVRLFQDHPEVKLLEGGLKGYVTGPRHYLGANIAYRREAAVELGGFSAEFAGWREDTEFGWRMEDAYGRDACRYDPDLAIEHLGPPQSEMIEPLEHRFRTRYPRRTFQLLYRPDSIGGRVTVRTMQTLYTYTPTLGRLLANLNPKM